MKIFYLRFLFLLVVISSCESNNNEIENLKKRNDSLDYENKKLKEQDYVQPIQNQFIKPYNGIDSNKAKKKIYAFVVLTVIEKNLDSRGEEFEIRNKVLITSQIQEFDNWDSDEKYRFMDKVQSNYTNSGNLFIDKILKRECFSFPSYQRASEEREKYVTEPE